FDYPTLPYTKANSQEELIESIRQYQDTKDFEKVDSFLQQLEIYEKGNASKQVVDHILKVVKIRNSK
ncbi:MAG: hypothetical protein K0S18_2130, partial [Anaerocolumna sp.]|nr:hypothetical protein [Anaerocolumna sp.]